MNKKILILIILLLFIILSSCSKQNESKRLRIIAESTSTNDVNDKITIKNIIEQLFTEQTINYNTLTCEELNYYLSLRLKKDLYQKLTIEQTISYYPAKAYKGQMIPSGNYETLLIKIGKGEGNNFWTLLYPEYFGYEFEENNEIQYRSYFYDLFN